MPEKWDPRPRTRDPGPIHVTRDPGLCTWDPEPGTHRWDPGPRAFTCDPYLGPGTLLYRNQLVDLLGLVFYLMRTSVTKELINCEIRPEV